MARTIEEIKADLAALEGEKGVGVKKGKLRTELIEAYDAAFGEQAATITAGPLVSAFYSDDLMATDPLESEEWLFVERVCAELDVDMKKGTNVGLVKDVFNMVDAKVKAWRVMRDIVAKLGVGAKWPQFAATGLNSSTGEPVHEHSILSDDWKPGWTPPPPKPEVVAAPAAAPKGIPIAADATTPESEAEAVKAQMGALIGARPERELSPVSPA